MAPSDIRARLEVGGLRLSYRRRLPEEAPKAALVYLHGIGGHCDQPTFTYLVERLLREGFALFGVDFRGHGQSEGTRGHVERWSDFLDDVSAMFEVVREEHPDIPLFLLGQSLGGFVALEYAIERGSDLFGVAASAPALATPNVAAWMPLATRVLARLAPKLAVDPKLDLAGFTRDDDELTRLREDPARQSVATVRLAAEFQRALPRVHAAAHRLEVPLLIILGEADRITPIEGAKSFFEAVPGSNKTLLSYPGGFHQPTLDTHRDEVLDDLVKWLDERLH